MILQGMDPYLKDIFEVGAWAAAIVGGGVAAFAAIIEMRANIKQRFAELRWRRAKAAKEILDDIHHHQRASSACTMMDWHEGAHEYEIQPDVRHKISYPQIIAALRKGQTQCKDAHEVFIVDCFDWFFYFIDRIEHYIRSGLVDYEDVAPVFKPYASKMQSDWDVFRAFTEARGYESAIAFWNRYPNRHPARSKVSTFTAESPVVSSAHP